MTSYRVRPRAEADLQEIGDYIAAGNPARAISFVREIRAVFTRIVEQPRAFPRRDDLKRGLRQAVHGRYLILFKAGRRGVVIVRVVHGVRRLQDLF